MKNPEPIGESVEEILSRWKARGEEPVFVPSCAELTEEELDCNGTYHFGRDPFIQGRTRVSRVCPQEAMRKVQLRVEEEQNRLAVLLAKCGYAPKKYPHQKHQSISRCLYDVIDTSRSVNNLARMLLATQEACKENPPQRNLAFLGPSGVAKTSCQLVIHFARLEAGIQSHFVDSIFLRDLFRRLSSFDDEVAREAERHLQPLLSSQSIVWSDVGDTREGGTPGFGESLNMLLERSQACWVISSNFSVEELRQHKDIGQRAMSRLLAQRDGNEAVVIGISGEDQRMVIPQEFLEVAPTRGMNSSVGLHPSLFRRLHTGGTA